MAMAEQIGNRAPEPVFRRVGVAEVDARRRISLGRLSHGEYNQYLVEEAPDGEVRLIPAMTVPAREMEFWRDPAMVASLYRGMEQVAAGEVVDCDDLAKYLPDDDPE